MSAGLPRTHTHATDTLLLLLLWLHHDDCVAPVVRYYDMTHDDALLVLLQVLLLPQLLQEPSLLSETDGAEILSTTLCGTSPSLLLEKRTRHSSSADLHSTGRGDAGCRCTGAHGGHMGSDGSIQPQCTWRRRRQYK